MYGNWYLKPQTSNLKPQERPTDQTGHTHTPKSFNMDTYDPRADLQAIVRRLLKIGPYYGLYFSYCASDLLDPGCKINVLLEFVENQIQYMESIYKNPGMGVRWIDLEEYRLIEAGK
jgi:hypothetical protein